MAVDGWVYMLIVGLIILLRFAAKVITWATDETQKVISIYDSIREGRAGRNTGDGGD